MGECVRGARGEYNVIYIYKEICKGVTMVWDEEGGVTLGCPKPKR